MNGWGHIGLTCVGKLEALVSVRSIGVEFQPQVVGGAVQDQPHQLISREGPQWTWGAVFSIINLGRIHKSSYHLVLFLSVSVSHSLSLSLTLFLPLCFYLCLSPLLLPLPSTVGTQQEGSYLLSRKRSLTGNCIDWYLDLGFPSRQKCEREQFLWFKPPSLWHCITNAKLTNTITVAPSLMVHAEVPEAVLPKVVFYWMRALSPESLTMIFITAWKENMARNFYPYSRMREQMFPSI